jgi:hypothetical protein
MRLPQVRFTLQRAMLGIVVISVLLGVATWARSNVPISYEEIPTRSGPAEYRAYYADGTFRENDGKSGRWVRDTKSGRWVIMP